MKADPKGSLEYFSTAGAGPNGAAVKRKRVD